MNKMFSLLRASMSEGMNIFRISGRKQSKVMRIGLPIIVAVLLMFSVGFYADMMMEPLVEVGMEFVVLTLFVVIGALFILVEGVYKASGLLFNCRDDDMLLSLPIKKSTVLFVRILKFYFFQVMVNALILLPAMIAYAMRVDVGVTFYLVSGMALLVLPMLPVAIACAIGSVIAFFSAKFRFKSFAQIIITTLFLLVLMYASFNMQDIVKSLAENATSINEVVTKLYFPAGEYVGLVTDFKGLDLVKFLGINLGIFGVLVAILGSVYYKINSRVKVVKSDIRKKEYKIRATSPLLALIKKEASKFTSSPVFVINAGFGLVLFVVACILICVNIQEILRMFAGYGVGVSTEFIIGNVPVVLFGLVVFASMTSSITSSMISLEGKSFNILKSLPVRPVTIILAKVLTAVFIMMPFILLGDLIMFVNFEFSAWQIVLILVASVIWPLVAEMVGIIVNLKYPKMDAKNDTEVVKQSMSSAVSVFVGIGVVGVMVYLIYMAIKNGFDMTLFIAMGTLFGAVILAGLLVYLKFKGAKEFNSINV